MGAAQEKLACEGSTVTTPKKFKHFLLTRYLVRMTDAPADLDRIAQLPREAFMKRFDLFKRVCLPTVATQTSDDFTWLVFFDSRVDPEFVDVVRSELAPYPHFEVVIVDRFDDAARTEILGARLDPSIDWLLTTRLDNDDGLHRNFVARLQAEVRPGQRECLNFPVGILYWKDRTYLYRHPSNAFISLSEPAQQFRTAACGPHLYIDRVAPIRQLDSAPAFIQVVHGDQVSNKPRGVRVHRLLALDGFGAANRLFNTPDAEKDWEIVRDNVTIAPAWALRDGALKLYRAVAGRSPIDF